MVSSRNWCLLALVVILSITGGYGQDMTSQSLRNLQDTELRKALLYQGRIYQRHPAGIEGSPGFKDLAFVSGGTVVYDGIRYADVILLYDVVKDELIILHPDGTTSIALVKPFVAEFTISGDTLVNVVRSEGGLDAGYYQRLLAIPSGTCLVKRQKKISHFASATERRSTFVESNRYFIRPLGNPLFHEIKGQSALLKHFKSQRKQLRSLLFEHRVRFREQPEEAIRLVLNYMAHTNIQ